MTTTQPTKKYIVYKRLSKESKSGGNLGLDAQQTAIDTFLRSQQNYEILQTVEEIETGTKKRQRPIFNKAVEDCKKHNATLLIAKLDRMSRDLGTVVRLQESKVDFLALDLRDASPLTIHIFAAIAMHEAKIISDRIKAALAEAKKRGTTLGKPENFSDETRRKGREVINAKRKSKAQTFAYMTAPRLQLLRKQGRTLQSIADEMNSLQTPQPSGKVGSWTPTTVRNCLKTAHYL